MSYITDLDDALAESGEWIILRRIVNNVNIDVTVRANTRIIKTRRVEVLIGGIDQDEYNVIISPTQIAAAQWPGGGIDGYPPFDPDRSLPRRGDLMIMKGRRYHLENVDAISAGGEVVRIEFMAKGGASGD